jgi:zinc protease
LLDILMTTQTSKTAAPPTAAPLTAAAPAIAGIRRLVTPRGIEVWFVRQTSLPLLAMDFAFAGGASQDPAGQAGATYLMTGLMDEGAGDLDADAFQTRLADKAISISFDAGRDEIHGSLQTLSRHASEAFDLLKLALAQPRFDADSVERVRAQVKTGLMRAAQNPESICREAFAALTYPGHPYGLPVKGTMATVEALEVATLRAQASRLFRRAGLKIAVVGDIEETALIAAIDAVFGSLPEDTGLVAVPGRPVPAGLGQVSIIEMDVPQTVLRFAGTGLMRRDPDFVAATVVNHILGGSAFTSRLFMEVREKRGLAYGVSSSLFPMNHGALHVGGTATKNERAAESLEVIRAEMAKLAAEGPTAEEVEAAKNYLIGSYPLRFDSSQKIVNEMLRLMIDGFAPDYIGQRNGEFAAVTTETAARVARRLYGDGLLAVQAVGKPVGLA